MIEHDGKRSIRQDIHQFSSQSQMKDLSIEFSSHQTRRIETWLKEKESSLSILSMFECDISN